MTEDCQSNAREVWNLLHFSYLIARIVAAILPISASYWIAERVADLWYDLSPRLRNSLHHNLALIPHSRKDEGERTRLSRKIVRNFARVVTEFLYLPKMNMHNIEHYVDVNSFDRLVKVLDNRPTVLVTAHIGNWELGAAVVAMLGVNLYVVAYDHPNKRIAAMFRSRREAKGLKVMSVRGAAKTMPKVLEFSSVGVLGDRDFTKQGMETSVFGVSVTVPSAYASLALAKGVPVVPALCVRQRDGRYHLVLDDPIWTKADQKDARSIVEHCIRVFEKYVEKYTEQWYLFERLGGRETK